MNEKGGFGGAEQMEFLRTVAFLKEHFELENDDEAVHQATVQNMLAEQNNTSQSYRVLFNAALFLARQETLSERAQTRVIEIGRKAGERANLPWPANDRS
jgi:hypothetical protein